MYIITQEVEVSFSMIQLKKGFNMYIKIKSKESIRNTPDAFYNENGDRTELSFRRNGDTYSRTGLMSIKINTSYHCIKRADSVHDSNYGRIRYSTYVLNNEYTAYIYDDFIEEITE